MADGPQDKATIQLDTALEAGEQLKDVLLPTGILGQEAISRPFVYTLTLLSRDFAIAPGKLLGTAAGIRIRRDGATTVRGLHGFVAAFSGGALHPKRSEFRTYSMRVVPWLSFLDQGTQFRIFQDKTVLQVIDTVLRDAIKEMFRDGASPGLSFRMRVQPGDRYPVLQFCVQYDETDFNFVSRLMEQHGIHYFFDQTDTNHTMVIVDGPPYAACDEAEVSFVSSPKSRGTVDNWTHSFVPRLRRWTFRDRDYRQNPPVTEKSEDTVITEVAAATEGDHFAYPGGFAVLAEPGKESAYAATLARTRMQEEEARFDVFNGNTQRASFAAGRRVRIIGVAEQATKERITAEEDKDYLITSVNFTATETAHTHDKAGEIVLKLLHDAVMAGVSRGAERVEEAAKSNLPSVNKTVANLPNIPSLLAGFAPGFFGSGAVLLLDLLEPVLNKLPVIRLLFPKQPVPPPYTNSFTGVPLAEGRQYRAPSLSPKPRVRGPQTAVVFGQTDNDVATDEMGRVRVKFDWDRTAKGGKDPETNSCFLRVAQGWAGSRWGMQFMPRVGEEVLVDFIDGDPDRPIITGRVYDALHKPPFELTKYRLQSGIKTRSVPLEDKAKDRFHMLRFDDTAKSEQVLLRSQKRLDVRAFGSTYETTGGSRFAHVGFKDDKEGQGGDFDITVGNDYQLHVNGGHYERVEKDLNLSVAGKLVQDLQSDAATMVKGKATLNAATIILEAKQKISLKVGGNAIVIDPAGITIIGTVVKINSGGQGLEAGDTDIEDPVDAAVSDTGEPGWLEKHKGGPGGGGRKKRKVGAQHFIAPPRAGESAQMTAMRNRLNQTPTGRNAMNVYDRDNVQFVPGVAGQGTFYTPPDGRGGGNTVTLDPTDQSPASTMVHEMNHADAQHSGLTPDPKAQSKPDYVNAVMAEDAHGEVLAQKEHNELATIGDPEPGTGNPFTRGVYDAAAKQGADDYKAAHPDATQDEIDAAGERAGEARVNKSYRDGNVKQSTIDPVTGQHETYNDSAGKYWDRVNPPPRP